jgi:uncharacterized protein (DUF488 family)
MPPETGKIIYTIGHSTRPPDEFIKLLRHFEIKVLTDIRSYPGSRRYPHFNKEALHDLLKKHGIQYLHLPGLGGRRKPSKDSENIAWKNDAFRGYADYMQSDIFKKEIIHLEEIALQSATAYMCSEAVWWRCHRALVSDYLKSRGWIVLHIMSETKAEEHPYTSAAKIINGKLDYSGKEDSLF